jgi:hypothetical protein
MWKAPAILILATLLTAWTHGIFGGPGTLLVTDTSSNNLLVTDTSTNDPLTE